jgi:hypothetical protein
VAWRSSDAMRHLRDPLCDTQTSNRGVTPLRTVARRQAGALHKLERHHTGSPLTSTLLATW